MDGTASLYGGQSTASLISSSDDGRKNRNVADDEDSPKVLIRRENQVICIIRVLLGVTFVGAMIGTAAAAFFNTRQAEDAKFRAEYDAIAGVIVETIEQDIFRYFNTARGLSNTVTMTMELSGKDHVDFALDTKTWNGLTADARSLTGSFLMTWAPYLENDQERLRFEENVARLERSGFFNEGVHPTCYVCDGDPNLGFVNGEQNIFVPGIGTVSCHDVETAALSGQLSPALCPLPEYFYDTCTCGPVVVQSESPFSRNPSEGIFVYEPTKKQGSNTDYEISKGVFHGGPYSPMWLDVGLYSGKLPLLFDMHSDPILSSAINASVARKSVIMSSLADEDEDFSYFRQVTNGTIGHATTLFFPVFSSDGDRVVGHIVMRMTMGSLLRTTTPNNGNLVRVIVENTCGEPYTLRVQESNKLMISIGKGDLHDVEFDNMAYGSSYERFEEAFQTYNPAAQIPDETCRFRFVVYPTKEMRGAYYTNDPHIYAGGVILIFFFTGIIFAAYDRMIRRRQEKIMKAATRTNDLVSSLFPSNVRQRILEGHHNQEEGSSRSVMSNRKGMSSFLAGDVNIRKTSVFGSEPIADLFPHATIMFIDIVQFTSWCSERDPQQVFTLLENLYKAFDDIGEKMGAFKIETIGDSYVSVAGLPTAREDHAVVMSRYAWTCLSMMRKIVQKLEISLGPSTGDLKARCGLHSGQVTAGVLRGSKARFQLFGDSVNMASRLENSGSPGKIHASASTAALIESAGHKSWLVPRESPIDIKGKGKLDTYFVYPYKNPDSLKSKQKEYAEEKQRNERLITWNVEILWSLLTPLMASRHATPQATKEDRANLRKVEESLKMSNGGVIDEMTAIVSMPPFDVAACQRVGSDKVMESIDQDLAARAKGQLKDFVTQVSKMYKDVPFHNFEHASQVVLSAGKLMKRVMNPEDVVIDDYLESDDGIEMARSIHNITYGLSSDYLLQFVVAFAGLIHDADHTGLTNKELVDMNDPRASQYREKSVAEQLSIDIAWDLLMEDSYTDLRSCIYTNEQELRRFRELMVDAVLATDIADKELQCLRKNRWADAFAESTGLQDDHPDPNAQNHVDVEQPADWILGEEKNREGFNRKATIVFEHIIQASDVSHCMQHWHVYQRFNERLFEERYLAWRKGVAGPKAPWEGWYGGELWFFDNYILPLARKLSKCGVFGVSHHETLAYAEENRAEWESKGKDIVERLRKSCEEKYSSFEGGNIPVDFKWE